MAVQKKARSGNPATRAQSNRSTKPVVPPDPTQNAPTSANKWVSKEGHGDAEIILLPSGNKALVRRTGPEAFLQQGLIPDTLTPIVEKSIHEKRGLRPMKQKELLDDPAALGSLVEMLDRTLCYAVIDPKVSMPPACIHCGELDVQTSKQHKEDFGPAWHEFNPAPRKPGLLYADRVDFDDKMFIMNFCVGGTRDLEKFRRETGVSMAGILDSAVMSKQAE